MANENKKYIPALRFPEFQNDGEWKEYQLGQIFSRITQRNSLNNQNVLTISAQYGLISQYDYFNKNVAAVDVSNYFYISKYDFAYNKSKSQGYPYGAIKPLKLYENGVVSPLYICFKIKDKKSYINTFFEYYFESELMHKEIDKISQEGARNHGLLNISTKDFFDKIALHIPPYWEQQKIADCLSSLDKYIDATKRKLELLKEYKNGLMQYLFPTKGKTVPELRFPEFQNDGEWGWKKLGEFLYEHKTKSDGKCEVHSVSVSKGVINQKMYLGRSFAASDTSNYKLVKPNDVIYTKSPTGNFPFGIVKQSFLDYNVIVSPLYAVYSPTNRYVGYLIQAYFESPIRLNNYLYPIVKKGAKNTIQITNEEFLSQEICLPSNENEQQKIAYCLFSLDNAIAALENKTFELEIHKKGLLQQIFPNNII